MKKIDDVMVFKVVCYAVTAVGIIADALVFGKLLKMVDKD